MLPAPPPVSERPWTIRDFFVVVLAGFAGGFVGALVGLISDDLSVVLVAGLLAQYGGSLLAIALLLRRKGLTWGDLGLEVRPLDGLYVGAGVVLQVALVLLFAPLAYLLGQEGSAQSVGQALPDAGGVAIRALLVLGIALLAPAVEEIMFRGVLLQSFEGRGSRRSALVWTSAIFALFHLLGLSSENFLAAAALALPQLFIVGWVLGALTQRRGRLGPAIMLHAGYNLIAVIVLLVGTDLPV